jgi:predicted AAA+ superfamily ATPase
VLRSYSPIYKKGLMNLTNGPIYTIGSQNFHLLNSITQTLAGRVAVFKLLPLDITELKQSGQLAKPYTRACLKGFYPTIYDRDIDPAILYANYIQPYIEKDVTD